MPIITTAYSDGSRVTESESLRKKVQSALTEEMGQRCEFILIAADTMIADVQSKEFDIPLVMRAWADWWEQQPKKDTGESNG